MRMVLVHFNWKVQWNPDIANPEGNQNIIRYIRSSFYRENNF